MNNRRYIDIDELKSIQLNILDRVANYCEDHHLTYFLGYGSLIGAVRHHGYIPWDDDIDIVMPRPDYDQFVAHFNDYGYSEQVIDHSNNKLYSLPYAKVHDIRTVIHETMYKAENVFGVYIDVFPLDGYRSSFQLGSIKLISRFLNAKKAIINCQRPTAKNFIIITGKILLAFISTSCLVNIMDHIARRANYNNSKMVKSFFSVYGSNEVCEKQLLNDVIWESFEGKKYRIPKNYDVYLRHIYGDYMQLPPIEQQVTHHVFKAWWS